MPRRLLSAWEHGSFQIGLMVDPDKEDHFIISEDPYCHHSFGQEVVLSSEELGVIVDGVLEDLVDIDSTSNILIDYGQRLFGIMCNQETSILLGWQYEQGRRTHLVVRQGEKGFVSVPMDVLHYCLDWLIQGFNN